MRVQNFSQEREREQEQEQEREREQEQEQEREQEREQFAILPLSGSFWLGTGRMSQINY